MSKRFRKYTYILFILFMMVVGAQKNQPSNDIFSSFDYDKLRNEFNANLKLNRELAHKYARAYYLKARKQYDTVNQIYGFHLLSTSANDYETSIYLLDSIIDFAKDFDSDIYPALASAYYMKSELQYLNNNYKNALDNALEAHELLREEDDNLLKYIVKSSIAIQRARIGEHEEALKFYHKSLSYFKDNNLEYYEMTLFGLAESHMALKEFDSTKFYSIIGLRHSCKTESKNYAYFIYCFGELAYHNGQYKQAIDSLVKSRLLLRKLNDLPNLALNEYWLGTSKQKLGQKIESIKHFKVIDSIFDLKNTVPLVLKDSWVKLIKYYHDKEDIKSELYYSKKLLKVDSTLNADYKYVSQNIITKFVMPNLLEKNKENLLKHERYKKIGKLIVVGLAATILLSIVLFYFYRRNEHRKYRTYEKVIERLNQPRQEKKEISNRKLEFSQDLIDKLENGLQLFEDNKEFLFPKITLGKIAKKLGTNSKYLSQFINFSKGMKFPDYINSLRIDYALRRLQTNEGKFRAWKLNAIALELGFNSREYYVKAFEKHTGMRPNQYLYQLKKVTEKHRNS